MRKVIGTTIITGLAASCTRGEIIQALLAHVEVGNIVQMQTHGIRAQYTVRYCEDESVYKLTAPEPMAVVLRMDDGRQAVSRLLTRWLRDSR